MQELTTTTIDLFIQEFGAETIEIKKTRMNGFFNRIESIMHMPNRKRIVLTVDVVHPLFESYYWKSGEPELYLWSGNSGMPRKFPSEFTDIVTKMRECGELTPHEIVEIMTNLGL